MKKGKTYRMVSTASSILLYTFCCILTISCIKNDDDPQPPGMEPVVEIDTTQVVRDSAFMATREYMLGEWMSEYVGFDPMQNANSAIRRLFHFCADGSYDSHIQGINNIQADSTVIYKEFEHEHGTFAFDAEKQLMTYTVEYDSLLNFFTDQLEFNAGKVQQGISPLKQYEETIYFSREQEGKRDWIRVDENLWAPDDHSARLVYIMKNQ